MEETDRESWRRVGNSFDAAAFQRRQDQAVSSDRERRDAAFLEAAEALLGDDDTSSESSVRVSPTTEPHHGSRRKRHHGERKSKHKSKKKEKKRKHRDDAYDQELQNIIAAERSAGASARRPQVSQWLTARKETPSAAGYYFDTRGDPGNLAFGELYRGDVASYRRFDPGGFLAHQAGASNRDRPTVRYFSAPVARALRRRQVEPWRPSQGRQQDRGKPGARQPAAPSFLPFSSVDTDTAAVHEKSMPEKPSTAKTIAFNVRAREHPEDLQNWLDFATFQDDLAREQGLGRTKGASERSTAEKKVAILEAALRFHSNSDALLLALLEAAKPLCDEKELSRRWQNILQQHPGSPLLWQAYLNWCSRRSFAGFAVHEVTTLYGQAVTALGQEIAVRQRHGTPAGVMEPLERETVALALQGILFLREAGLTEWFVAAIQATLEYHYFAPKDWDEEARQAMFEDFWLSGAPFIGEPGAQGWSAWLDSIQSRSTGTVEPVHKVEESDVQIDSSETGAGKWAGWEDLAPAIQAKFGHRLDMSATEDVMLDAERGNSAGEDLEDRNPKGGPEADSDLSDVEHDQEEESEEALLARLGLELEAALEDKQAITDDVVLDWLEMEREQSKAQWKPVRLSDAELSRRLEETENESPLVELDRLIPWSRVSHLTLLPVTSTAARQELLLGILGLLGAPLPELALSSGCPAQRAITTIQDAFEPYPLAREMASEDSVSVGKPCSSSSSEPWYLQDSGRSDFLVRLLRTLVEEKDLSGGIGGSAAVGHESSSDNGHLLPSDCRRSVCQALLQAVGQAQGFDAARALAKELLSQCRDDVDLWEALMLVEWRAGKIKTARKVAYTCLSSRNLVPLSLDDPYACLLFSAVQLECGVAWAASGVLPLGLGLSQAQRGTALRLLAWYGSAGGVALPDHTGGPEPVTLADSAEMAARKGYQAFLGEASASRQGALSAHSAAAVAAAASFELVSPGRSVTGALRVLDGFLESVVAPKDAFASTDSTATLLEQLRHQMRAHRKQTESGANCPSAALEVLAVMRSELAISAAELSPPAVPPIHAASHVLASLLPAFPDSPSALRLLPRVAALGVGLTRVRAALRTLLDASPTSGGSSPLVSDAAVRLEAVVGGPLGVVRRAAEASLRRPVCEHWPAGWRALLCLEQAHRQTPDLRRSVLRAVAACPWVKGLWIDGLRALVGHVPARELAELIDAMREKQVSVRTDLLEAVLKRM